jgi:quinol monooxygenase YgiN
MGILRLFQTAVDPADVDEIRRLFLEDVKPVFDKLPGCLGIELLTNVDPQAGGLVEGAAISRWESQEDLDRALETRDVAEAQVRILQLLRQEPVTKTFQVLE